MPFRHSVIERVVVVGSRPEIAEVAAETLEPIRIIVGEPVMGVDITEKTIPQEGVDVAASVDFAKGCYLGQELVARIDSRGHVNRRLVGLEMNAAVAPGADVVDDETVVGAVTSSAWLDTRGRAVALAMVRVEVEPGARVSVAGTPGVVQALPMSW
jgi:folate-binding protein YgfZ